MVWMVWIQQRAASNYLHVPEGVVEDVSEGVVGHDAGASVIVHRDLDRVADRDAAREVADMQDIASSDLSYDCLRGG